MALDAFIYPRPVIDSEDFYPVPAAVLAGAVGQVVLTAQLKAGKRAYVRAIGNDVDAAGVTFITFRLLVNGSRRYPYDGTLNQWGPPQLMQELRPRLELPQLATIQVVCDNADAVNAYNVAARIQVEYEDF